MPHVSPSYLPVRPRSFRLSMFPYAWTAKHDVCLSAPSGVQKAYGQAFGQAFGHALLGRAWVDDVLFIAIYCRPNGFLLDVSMHLRHGSRRPSLPSPGLDPVYLETERSPKCPQS
nr:hypothetical protein CFP56_56485 [Quercus suber]